MHQSAIFDRVFPFIFSTLSSYKGVTALFITLSLCAGLWGPLNSFFMKELINTLSTLPNHNITPLIGPGVSIVINFIVFDNITWRGINYLRGRYAPQIINDIIQKTLQHVLGHSYQFFQERLSGNLSKQLMNLAEGIEKIITTVASNFLRCFSLLLTAFIAAYFVNSVFFFILIAWFVVFFVLSIFMSAQLVQYGEQQSKIESEVIGDVVDLLSNHANVRSFARLDYEMQRLNPELRSQEQAYAKTCYYALGMHIIQGGLIALMLLSSIGALIYLYADQKVSIGDFSLILGLSTEVGYMTWFTMSHVDEFNKALGRCQQSLKILTTAHDITDRSSANILFCQKGNIVFDNVFFQYSKAPSLFQDKSIVIKPGQKVGLVGYSGSGKSTFVNLILRYYDLTHGAIFIDGQNIALCTQQSLRESIAYIPQDPSLFHRSILENIRYGKVTASDQDVIEAAKKAHAHNFIEALPQGYHTLVGERGVKLSGGQRQRIAIARAILKDAPILILDEATSQLDSITENLIQESLYALMNNKTTLVIAHRLSTLQHMDRILVFDQGSIVQDGPHSELITHSAGLYKKLWDTQAEGFLTDPFGAVQESSEGVDAERFSESFD